MSFLTHKRTIISLSFLLVMISLPFISQANATASMSTPTEARIGVMFSVKCNGLTVGTNYAVVATHSDGNVTRLITAASATEYVRFTLTTADSDGIVPIIISEAASGAGGTDIATNYVNLVNPTQDIPSAFFQLLLPVVLIIGIFVLLMGAFFINRRRR